MSLQEVSNHPSKYQGISHTLGNPLPYHRSSATKEVWEDQDSTGLTRVLHHGCSPIPSCGNRHWESPWEKVQCSVFQLIWPQRPLWDGGPSSGANVPQIILCKMLLLKYYCYPWTPHLANRAQDTVRRRPRGRSSLLVMIGLPFPQCPPSTYWGQRLWHHPFQNRRASHSPRAVYVGTGGDRSGTRAKCFQLLTPTSKQRNSMSKSSANTLLSLLTTTNQKPLEIRVLWVFFIEVKFT